METKASEKLIAHIWQHKLVTELATDGGEQVHVIHPGRNSNTPGCDFRDAVFVINGRATTGNVEIHVRSSQWHSHGHHRDPKYNSIVLHVVWQHDSQTPELLQNGQAVPTVCLGSFLSSTLEELNDRLNLYNNYLTFCPEVGRHSNIERLNKLLTAAGEKRFASKTSLLRKAMIEEDAGQVLYRSICRALGYTQNAEPCEKLANKLPISILDEIKSEPDSTRQALVLGTAGLLPSQRHRSVKDGETAKLENIWQSNHIEKTMNETEWCFFRVRPDNLPTRRLIALSYLISRHDKTGLLQGILGLARKSPRRYGHRWLENSMSIESRGYWAKHLDFGIALHRNSALIGREKAAAIILNTILPFACAWGGLNSDQQLKTKAAAIYQQYPGTGDNELTHYMKQQLRLNPESRLSACQQQGLIHIFKTCCRHRNCTECTVATNRD